MGFYLYVLLDMVIKKYIKFQGVLKNYDLTQEILYIRCLHASAKVQFLYKSLRTILLSSKYKITKAI